MMDRLQIGAILYFVLTVFLLGTVLYFYWMIQEVWIANILISSTFLLGSLWLIIFWAMKVVFPFLNIVQDKTNLEENQDLIIYLEKKLISRWISGMGLPLVILTFDILALCYFPMSWAGILFSFAIVLNYLIALYNSSFFTKVNGSTKSKTLKSIHINTRTDE